MYEQMNVIELKSHNNEEIIQQQQSLLDAINAHIKKHKKVVEELVVDYISDYRDNKYYFLQIKHINTRKIEKDPFKYEVQRREDSPDLMSSLYYLKKNDFKHFQCSGDYCDTSDTLSNLPAIHQEIIYELFKKRENWNSKVKTDSFFENLSKTKLKDYHNNELDLPLDDNYKFYVMLNTIIQDRIA